MHSSNYSFRDLSQFKNNKKTFVYSFSFFSLFSLHRYETISFFLFLEKDLDFLIPTHSRRLTISFFVKKEMLMDDLRILVSKKKLENVYDKRKKN